MLSHLVGVRTPRKWPAGVGRGHERAGSTPVTRSISSSPKALQPEGARLDDGLNVTTLVSAIDELDDKPESRRYLRHWRGGHGTSGERQLRISPEGVRRR